MGTHRPELELVETSRIKRSAPAARGASVTGGHFDAEGLESLLLNLDASLAVHTRAQFFTWTQGLLQSLIRHRVLICALRNGKPTSFRVDSFSTHVADSGAFGELLLSDAAIASGLIRTWREGRYLPVSRSAGELGSAAGGALARLLKPFGAAEVLVHGTHDIDAQVRSLFIFGCEAGYAQAREAYIVQLIVPFLHWAWVRSQTTEGHDPGHVTSVGAGVLTEREREILHWVYLGKSNAEAAAILPGDRIIRVAGLFVIDRIGGEVSQIAAWFVGQRRQGDRRQRGWQTLARRVRIIAKWPIAHRQ